MRTLLILFLLSNTTNIFAQKNKAKNIIIITLDGFRWQEMYNGLDTSIANNATFNEGDSAYIYNKFYNKPILPFVTNTIGTQGQLWGNRTVNCNGSVANPYWFSYPGYSELFCGLVDTGINSNGFTYNPNTTLLDILQTQKKYKNKIAAFGAWNAFDRILNEPRAGFPVFNAFDYYTNKKSKQEFVLNKLTQESYKPFNEEECLDVYTHNMALDYLKTKHPKALFIGYGETDEWAHASKYKSYLNAAQQIDKWIEEIWNFVQSHKKYKNNTVLLVTVDRGRGIGNDWTSHNSKIANSNETWFGIIGANIAPKGIIQNGAYQQLQLAATLLQLLNINTTSSKMANGITL